MKTSPHSRLKSRVFLYLIVFSSILGFVFSIPYLPVVSAQFTPDNGVYTVSVTNSPLPLYSSGTVYKSAADTAAWITLWTGSTASYVDTSRYAGWQMSAGQKINKRAILWFDTMSLRDDLAIKSAYITLTSTHFGSAADKTPFYLWTYSDQSPPVTTSDYVKQTIINTTGFDGNSTARKIYFPVSYVNKAGFSTFMITGYPDYNLRDLGSQGASDRCDMYIASSSCTLTIEYDITPPQVQSASPINDMVCNPNPYLTASVKGYGGSVNGYARIYESVGGVWTLRSNFTVNGNDVVTVSYGSHDNIPGQTYSWRVACRLIGYPLYWHNYTFSFSIANPGVNVLDVLLSPLDTAYYNGSTLFIYTSLPKGYYDQHPGQWFIGVFDPNGVNCPIFPDGGSQAPRFQQIIDQYHGYVAKLWLGPNNVAGAWKVVMGFFQGGLFNYVDMVNFTVTYGAPNNIIFPHLGSTWYNPPCYLFDNADTVYYTLVGLVGSRFYNVHLMNASTGAKISGKSQNISKDFNKEFVGSFGVLPIGSYYICMNSSTNAYLNRSASFTVGAAVTPNAYTISVDKTVYYDGESISFTATRTSGSAKYVVMLCDSSGANVWSGSAVGSSYTDTIDLSLGVYSYGHYKLYVYDNGGGTADHNAKKAEFDYLPTGGGGGGGEQGDDWGSYFSALEPYKMLAAFAILLALGFFTAIKLHTPMAFPVTLFGGMVLCSVPGTPITVFPTVFIFVIGVALLLILLLVMKRG